MKKAFQILLFLITSCSISFAQRKGTQNQADTLNAINSFIQEMMVQWKVPSTVITIVKDGKPYYSAGFGLKNIRKDLVATPNTIFPIASCTKSFTAAALSMLADEGKLDWNKPIQEYLPEFQLYDETAARSVTARDILAHRTGLPRHDYVWLYSNADRRTIFSTLKYLKPTKSVYAQYQYNNLMYMVAGMLVEQLSGKTWEGFVRERLLTPLLMKNTVLSYTELFKTNDYALSYHNQDNKWVEAGFGSNVDAIAPAGGIKSSANDMTHWLLMHLQKGKFNGKQLISEKNLQENTTPIQVIYPAVAKYPELGFASYAMGWQINTYRGLLRQQHNGSIEGYRAQMTIFPQSKLGIFVNTNTDEAEYYFVNIITNFLTDYLSNTAIIDWNMRYKKEYEDTKFEEEKQRKEFLGTRKLGAMLSHSIESYAGIYENPAYGMLQIYKTDKGLKVNFHNRQVVLEHFHYDFFEATGELEGVNFNFPTNVTGEITKVLVTFPNAGEVEFKRR